MCLEEVRRDKDSDGAHIKKAPSFKWKEYGQDRSPTRQEHLSPGSSPIAASCNAPVRIPSLAASGARLVCTLKLSNSSHADHISFHSPIHRANQRILPVHQSKTSRRLRRHRGSRSANKHPRQVCQAGPAVVFRMPLISGASKSASMTQRGRSYRRLSRSIRLTMTIGRTMPCLSATGTPVRLCSRFARCQCVSDQCPQSDA